MEYDLRSFAVVHNYVTLLLYEGWYSVGLKSQLNWPVMSTPVIATTYRDAQQEYKGSGPYRLTVYNWTPQMKLICFHFLLIGIIFLFNFCVSVCPIPKLTIVMLYNDWNGRRFMLNDERITYLCLPSWVREVRFIFWMLAIYIPLLVSMPPVYSSSDCFGQHCSLGLHLCIECPCVSHPRAYRVWAIPNRSSVTYHCLPVATSWNLQCSSFLPTVGSINYIVNR